MKNRAGQREQQLVSVTALLGESTIKTVTLGGGASPMSRNINLAVGAVGLCLAAVGLVQVLLGQGGLAAMLLTVGLGQVVFAVSRAQQHSRATGFTLGSAQGADLHMELPELPPGSAHPLVQLQDGGPVLQLPGGPAEPIPPHSHQVVSLGDLRFFVQSTEPSKVGKGLAVDWEANVYHGASFTAHAALLFLVLAMPPADEQPKFDTRHRKVTLSLPQVEQRQDMLDILRRPQQEDAEQTEVDRKRPRRPRDRAGTPSVTRDRRPGGGGPINAKHLALVTAKKAGVLAALDQAGGAYMNSIFSADSALSDDATEALAGLQGNSIGEGMQIGGLSVTDGSHGYGPGSGIHHGPLGTIGKRSGGPGGGPGYGGGVRLPKRKKRNQKIVSPGRATVSRGSLSKSIIRRVIRRHLNEVRYCYQKELQLDRTLYGRLVVKFTIAPNGSVITSGIKQSTVGNRAVETCITQAVRRWLFPKPRDGGIVMVSYPFVLKNAGEQ